MPGNLSPERRAALERERSASGGRQGFYDFKNLTNDVIRLLPLKDTENIGTKWVYYFLNKKSYTCPEETHGQPSIIAKTIRALEKLGSEESLAQVTALKDARRGKFLMKIIARKDPTTPKWMEAPFAIYKVCLDAFLKDEFDICSAKNGRDVRISKDGTGRTSKYTAAVREPSLLAETREERDALRAASAEMDPKRLTASNEAGAKEALISLIPPHLWKQIKVEVLGADAAAAEPASTRRRNDDDEDAPSSTPAAGDEEDDRPAPAPKATRAAAPVEEDEAPAPAPKAASKPAPRPAVNDDEDEAPAPRAAAPAPARRAAAVVQDDEDAPPAPAPKAASKPAPRPAVQDDEDEGPARAPANRRAAVVVEEDERPAPAKGHKVKDDEEE